PIVSIRRLFLATLTLGHLSPSLHDALPIFASDAAGHEHAAPGLITGSGAVVVGRHGSVHQNRVGDLETDRAGTQKAQEERGPVVDRKSTRLNSSHVKMSYAVFCLK